MNRLRLSTVMALASLVISAIAIAVSCSHGDDFSTTGVNQTGPLAPGDTLRVIETHADTSLWGFVNQAGYFVQAVPRSFSCTAPCSLENGQPAHSWQTLRLYAYPRKIYWVPAAGTWADSGWVQVDSIFNCVPCYGVVFRFNDTSGGRWTTFQARAENGAGQGKEGNYQP